ncbi:MAG: LacI family transcriptional regulator [Chloroflexota bacterium]|nr:LacI family transcriptional regulator [Chloroflexota bacterium]
MSLALSGDPRVAAATRERLVLLAREHRYTPNAAARSLRRGRTGTVGIVLWEEVLREHHGRLQAQLVTAVETIIAREHQALVIPASRARLAREPIDRIVEQAPTDGAFFLGPTHDFEGVARLVRAGYPLVHCGKRTIPGDRRVVVPYVSVDFRAGCRLGVEHLVQRGHRRIAVLVDSQTLLEQANQRVMGYRDALADAGVPAEPGWVVQHQPGSPESADVVQRLRRLGVTAVFATRVHLALDLLRLCSSAGVRVPEELAVASFDDCDEAALANPPLTAVRQPTEEIAARAASLLMRFIDGGAVPAAERQQVLPVDLVVRQSSGGR